MRERVVCSERRNVGQLRLFGPQELLPGGNVEEKVAYCNGRTLRQGGLVTAQELPTGDLDARSGGFVAGLGLEQEPRNRRDGGYRPPARTRGRNREEVLDIGELACGVGLEGEHCVIAQHAAAVIDHPDEAAAA